MALQAIQGNLPDDWLGEDWQSRPHGLSMPNWRLRTDALALLAAAHRLRLLGAVASPTFPRDMIDSMKMPLGTRDGIDLNYFAARKLILGTLKDRKNALRDRQILAAAPTASAADKACPPVREEVFADG